MGLGNAPLPAAHAHGLHSAVPGAGPASPGTVGLQLHPSMAQSSLLGCSEQPFDSKPRQPPQRGR